MPVVGSLSIPTTIKAKADTPNYGDYLSGKDPEAVGASADAITVAVINTDQYSLQLRWSPKYKANWARIVIYNTNKIAYQPVTLRAKQDTGYQQVYSFTFAPGTYYTPMIYSPSHKVRAEIYDARYDPNFSLVCTSWI